MISCLNGLDHDLYKMLEVEELARHILMFQLCLSSWRAAHPYVLVDRFEDVTPPEKMDKDANCDRNISLYGYLRGCNIKSGIKVHIAGVGDFRLANVTNSADPFRLSSKMEEENDLIEPTHIENGFRAGNYLRLEVHNVPFGWVQNLDPSHPILVGGISPEEENVGHMQARLKLHNWHMKLLRSAEPVTVSAGWRRYQTNPIYGWEFNDGQRIMLEFNLEHGHCLASFCGPLAPPGTRIVVVQSNKDLFRIVAKAAVVDPKDRRVAKVVVVDPKDQLKLMEESKQIPKRRTALTRFGDELWLKRIKETKLKEIIRRTLKKTASKRTAPKRTSAKRTAPKRTAPKRTELEILTPPIQTQSITCGEVNKVCATYENNILSMLEERRRVEIIDKEPSSYPCSSHFMLLCRQRQDRETVVVMSEEKRAELVKKQQIEEFEKAEKEYFSGVRQLVDL
ncbi:hypothetical protein MKW94_017156 [Papaver nudicaule]|uniref:Ribosome biogenesis protein BMS1/TSR1 C-terminal domain-containing protein n=1 Tax=Papaver nudicaule TaxID=74823 RepID=A0AA41VLL5_PAPNU|nr:hypothetical protein [Papaver nudicaule]